MVSTSLMACVAGLLHLPAAPPPAVVYLPRATVEAIRSNRLRPQGVYGSGLVILSDGAPFSLLAHELAHATQDAAGLPYDTPAAERAAEYVQRHADAWCRP